ncbi:MAG: UDP-N-acetylglucosamine 2-epimerase [Candidatus Curtissbacteria bacterium GW2011_GWA1_41_11]|uniref:UDP-N-acetylglucosamine 2-epimerase (non-hydrolyzing) n=1 Tax=Candidatus Curtissbacteria bacterium GW2011_GWA1_41_11 TaxID=1618409 RepID=A0A0G0UKV2_9BACT|nr:MAG: UDP-N-acetylglucosamine 2-epimerase [Candidatus Curtissbacteria bacterium GW2011_GWA1_41_11]
MRNSRDKNKTIVCCFGTRPEFIKIAPVVIALRDKYPMFNTQLMCSGQHEELIEGLDKIFGLNDYINLKIRSTIGKTSNLSILVSNLINSFSRAFITLNPDAVLVQGDAASTFCAAVAAFHQKITIFYVEAGLRTYNIFEPFPEEGYRQMVTRIASLCFAPTNNSQRNLVQENVSKNRIRVVGNTAVDSLKKIRSSFTFREKQVLLKKEIPQLQILEGRKIVLVEIHRRENYGKPLVNILNALIEIQSKNPNYFFVFSVHPSRNIKPIVYKPLKIERGSL